MQLLTTQFVLFPANLIERPDLLFSEINSSVNNIFNGIPNMINMPLNAPADFPVVQVSSSDGTININIARGRIEFTINSLIKGFNNLEPLEEFKAYMPTINKIYRTSIKHTSITRTGIVFTCFEQADKGVKLLFNKSISIPYNENYVEAEIMLNKRSSIKGLQLNNITKIVVGNVTVNQTTKNGLIVLLDTNNLSIEGQLLTADNIGNILETASNKLKEKYFKELF